MSTPAVARDLALVLDELDRRDAYTFARYFPDCLPGCTPHSLAIADHVIRPGFATPICRALYPRSLTFFAAGRTFKERLFLAANRTSKTVTAAYEITAHATGRYPAWWPGKTFAGPTTWWVCGDTQETTRDIVQHELFGPRDGIRRNRFAGMVPAHLIVDRTLSGGVADCLDTVWVQHVERQHGAPCTSTIQVKSYKQGRLAFQGTTLSGGVWLDEEPPDAVEDPGAGGAPSGNGDIYTECLLRTATTEGLIIATFTPLRGLTPFVDHYLETAAMADAATGLIVNAKAGLFGTDERRA